jgi:hypothetical protein
VKVTRIDICTPTADQGGVAGQTPFGSVRPGLCAMSSPHVKLSMTMSYIGYNDDMHGFWSIGCFHVIWCSWKVKSTKLAELVSNKHISSISWMKYRYVGGKSMHFMTANNYLGFFAWSKWLTFLGSSSSHHIRSHYTRLILKHGTVYMTRQTPILLYGM